MDLDVGKLCRRPGVDGPVLVVDVESDVVHVRIARVVIGQVAHAEVAGGRIPFELEVLVGDRSHGVDVDFDDDGALGLAGATSRASPSPSRVCRGPATPRRRTLGEEAAQR